MQGNFIGTKGDGQSPLGNGQAGIIVNGPATIGGTATGEGNVIAYNGVDPRTGRGAGVTSFRLLFREQVLSGLVFNVILFSQIAASGSIWAAKRISVAVMA